MKIIIVIISLHDITYYRMSFQNDKRILPFKFKFSKLLILHVSRNGQTDFFCFTRTHAMSFATNAFNEVILLVTIIIRDIISFRRNEIHTRQIVNSYNFYSS